MTTMRIIGFLLVIAGGYGYYYSAPKLDQMRSGLGQLSLAFGGASAQASMQEYQNIFYGSVAAMIVGGIMVIAGALNKKETRR